MDADHGAVRLGVAIAAIGVLAKVIAYVSLVVVEYPVEPTGLPFFEDWSWDFVAYWVANRITQGMLLVAPVAAFHTSFSADRDVGPVLAGFALGAATYGAGIVAAPLIFGALYSRPAELTGLGRLFVWNALAFGATAGIGALVGEAMGPLFRGADGTDGDYPRW